MPTKTFTKDEHRARPSPGAPSQEDLRDARARARRVRRFKLNFAAWGLGTIVVTVLWVILEWQANGAFERFAHEGNPGDWNPTLWALVVGLWGLIVGIMGLRVHFERPGRLDGVRRLKFHVAAWVLGMAVLTPINLLIEWQDNGGFERWSTNSQPGSWDPWVLTIGCVWALVIAAGALWAHFGRRRVDTRSVFR